MRITLFAVLAMAVIGCGAGGGRVGPDPSINSATGNGPHGGPALPLPEGKGFAEVLIERGKSGGDARLIVYFLKPDKKAPIDAAPSGVKAKLVSHEGEVNVDLMPDPKPSDPAGAGRFASKPARFDADEYRGELSASMDGNGFTRPFALR